MYSVFHNNSFRILTFLTTFFSVLKSKYNKLYQSTIKTLIRYKNLLGKARLFDDKYHKFKWWGMGCTINENIYIVKWLILKFNSSCNYVLYCQKTLNFRITTNVCA